jgi:hypothetical protein
MCNKRKKWKQQLKQETDFKCIRERDFWIEIFAQKQKKISLCVMITLNFVPSLVSVFFDTPDVTLYILCTN